MAFKKKNVYGSIPATTRGKPTLIGGDPKGENILYCCGQSVVIRNLKNPLICDLYNEHQTPPTVARYSPSGFYIASGDTSGTIRIWDTTQAEHILKFEIRALSGQICDLAWTDDSKRIVAVGDGKERFGSAFIWDSGASVGEITGHSKMVSSVDIRQARPYRVITGGEDFLVNWFEGPPFKFKCAHKDHSRFVNCVRFNKDGSLVASVSSDKKGIIYDGKTGEKKHELSEADGHKGGIYCCSWSADGKQLLTSSGDKTCKLWDVETAKSLTTFTFGNDTEDQQLGCLWQGDTLLSLSLSGVLNYLDVNNPSKPRQIIRGHNKFVTALAHDKAKNKVYTGSYDALITAWDINTGATEDFPKIHTNQIAEMNLAGDVLVSIGMDDSARITRLSNPASGDKIALDSPGNGISTNKDGSLTVAVSNNTVYVIRGGKVVGSVAASYGPKSVALSPSENEVVVGGSDNNLYFYSLSGNSLSQTKKVEKHRGPIGTVAYSPDGKLVASGDNNREIVILDASSKSVKNEGWVYHTARVNSIAFSPNSQRLASGGLDQNIIVWSIGDNSRIVVRNAHQGGVNSVLWLDDQTLASAGQDCTWKTHVF